MRKLRIGIWIGDIYANNPEIGGGFSYQKQITNLLMNYIFKDAEVIFLSYNEILLPTQKKYTIKWRSYQPKVRSRLSRISRKIFFERKNNDIEAKKIKENRDLLKAELNQVVDVIYYPVPICEFPDFPYIYTLWDLGHLSMYAFPEVSMNNVFEQRKKHHDLVPYKALMIFAESETGKKEICQYLSINENRVKVIPIFPSEIIDNKILQVKPAGLSMDEFFIHYPAQFWAHKNHYNLLHAFKKVLSTFPSLKLVFTGADKGNKAYIIETISTLGLENCVVNLGFVSIEELKWLYLHSKGLVMPTFLGPTNMPLLEAAELNCPVCCSQLKGHIEQVDDYAYYFNPQDVQSITEAIVSMINDNLQGNRRNYKRNFTIEKTIQSMDEAFSELRNIRFTWGSHDLIF